MIKAVIFDFDGVLVESAGLKTNAFAKLFEAEGSARVKKIVDYHLDNQGVSRFDKFRYIYKNILQRELSWEEFDGLCQRFSKLVKDQVIAAPYVFGALEFLKEYSCRYACFISSATPQAEMEDILRARGIDYYFKGIFGAPKRKEDIVTDIKYKNKFDGSEIVYIGDALSDYKAAFANSVRFIARIHDNKKIFTGIECTRLNDLVNLNEILVSGAQDESVNGKTIILVHGSFSAFKIAKAFPGTKWLFFDQGYLERMKWEKVLGISNKIGYKDELTAVSYALRDEFVDWSARLGKPHWNTWYWWVTRLAGRNNLTSRLYLYVCYLEVFKTMLNSVNGPLMVISNSWELLDSVEIYCRKKAAVLKPCLFKSLALRRYYWIKEKVVFCVSWGVFLIKSIFELAASRLTRLKNHPRKDHIYDKNHIVIHSCIDPGCIGSDGKFSDRYHPGLAKYLRSSGKKVSTLAWLYNFKTKDLFNVFSWFRKNEESFLIPQDYYNFADVLKAIIMILKSSMFKFTREDVFFRDVDLALLINPEQGLQSRDTGAAYFVNRLKVFDKFKRLGYNLSYYVDMWELKNCEVEAIMAIREHYPECITVAFQHGALMPKMLFCNYKTVCEEFEAYAHPVVGVANSEIVKNLLIRDGFPASFVKVGPALRYIWLKKYAGGDLISADKKAVLVCLSLSYDISSEILEMVYAVFANKPGHAIWIKVHPMMNLKRLQRLLSFSWPADFILVNGSMEDWLKRSCLVVTSQSSAMVDAVSMGRKTIVISRETDLDVMPLDILDNLEGWKLVGNAKELADTLERYLGTYKDGVFRSGSDFFEFRMELLNEIFN